MKLPIVNMGGVSEEAVCYPLNAYTHGYMRTNINERSLANQVSSYQYVSLSKAMLWEEYIY